jgi:hypothetical protein
MYVHLANPETSGLYLFIFDIYRFICHGLVSIEYEHSSLKNRGPLNEPRETNENSSSDFDEVPILSGDPKLNCIGGIFKKLMAHALRAKL